MNTKTYKQVYLFIITYKIVQVITLPYISIHIYIKYYKVLQNNHENHIITT